MHRVLVDADVAGLVPPYLDGIGRTLLHIRSLLHGGDFEGIASLGQQLYGSGGGYGFSSISILGLAIGRAAAHGDSDGVLFWVNELERYLAAVEWVVVDQRAG